MGHHAGAPVVHCGAPENIPNALDVKRIRADQQLGQMLLNDGSAAQSAFTVTLHAFVGRDLHGKSFERSGLWHEERPIGFVLGIDGHGTGDFDASGGPRTRSRRITRKWISGPGSDQTDACDSELALLGLEGERAERREGSLSKKSSAAHAL